MFTNAFDRGDAGTIAIETPRLTLADGGQIGGATRGTGRGGDITVIADDSVRLSGFGGMSSVGSGSGASGRIRIATPVLALERGAQIKTDSLGSGRAGDIDLTLAELSLTGGSQIGSSAFAAGAGGTIRIAATAGVALAGRSGFGASGVFSSTLGAGDAGAVAIETPRLLLEQGAEIGASTLGAGAAGAIGLQVGEARVRQGARIESSSVGAGRGGDVTLAAAERIALEDGGGVFSNAFADGAAGRLALSAPLLELRGGVVEAAARGAGTGGQIALEAATLRLEPFSLVNASTGGSGRGGDIALHAERLSLTGATVGAGTAGPGDAGRIDIRADELDMAEAALVDTRTIADGDAGSVHVSVDRLSLRGGAQIGSSSGVADVETGERIVGRGAAGEVSVTARESVLMVGRGPGGLSSGVFGQTGGPGEGGRVRIDTPQLVLGDGARIGTDTAGSGRAGEVTITAGSATLSGGARIASDNAIEVGARRFVGEGAAGSLRLDLGGGRLRLDGAELSSSTFSAGRGGDIEVRAGRVELAAGARIAALSQGSGDAGDIHLRVADTFDSRDSGVSTEALRADGGNIALEVGDTAWLRGSALSATVGEGGDGGNVGIGSRLLIVDGDSGILASAERGRGGNIRIVIDDGGAFVPSSEALISASSRFGVDGTVIVQGPDADLSGGLVDLPGEFLDATGLLSEPCAVRFVRARSSLVIAGRGSGAPDPEGPLPAGGALAGGWGPDLALVPASACRTRSGP